MPPPSAALTVQSVTPAGVSPPLLTSAQMACSSTVVPEAVVVPPREMNQELPATPALATSANAAAMLCASASRAGEDEVVGEDRVAVLVLVGEAVGDELVFERRRVDDQHARAAVAALGALDGHSGGRAGVLERELRECGLELRLDQIGDQAGVADVTGADDR
jgi:hypothetical protein